jgi:hypothetical protein
VSGRARWAIGAGIFLSAYLVGYLLSQVPAAGDLGVVVAVVGMGLLSWLVPVVLGSAQERKRPRPRLDGTKAHRLDDQGRWWLVKDGYWWRHDARDNTWLRGDRLPLTGDTRDATWALRRDELLREQNRLLAEQNRLLAGLPPTPPEGPVVRAGDPWQPEPPS